jgi:predicted RNase H-like HicB family nuclease
MKKTFLVVYEKGRKNYSGFAPDVGGCGGLGDTLEEVRADLQFALELYMNTCVEFGYALPEPVSNSVTLPIEGETDPKVTYVVERLSVNMPKPKTSKRRLARVKSQTTKRRVKQAA